MGVQRIFVDFKGVFLRIPRLIIWMPRRILRLWDSEPPRIVISGTSLAMDMVSFGIPNPLKIVRLRSYLAMGGLEVWIAELPGNPEAQNSSGQENIEAWDYESSEW